MSKITAQQALDFHAGIEDGKPGKIGIHLTKDMSTAKGLALAYSPGVGYPCLEIQKDKENAYKYTAKGNTVAIISNGTAVLGFGDIGHLASKPVMEGKAGLLKAFANIDSIDIEVDEKDPEKLAYIISKIGETWGGINLEDIKAPECFIVEKIISENLDIPIFHDDQHGTAVVNLAGLINALKIAGKNKEDVKVVFNGAGAASTACRNLMIDYGFKAENIIVCDTKGVIYKGRKEGMNEFKEMLAIHTEKRTLQEAIEGCDVLLGLSVKDAFTNTMIKSMAKNPIIFAMANPNPEILPEQVFEIRDDAIMATGRSDYPNQVNNVLAFPYIFRAALDCRSTAISSGMKLAAAEAIAKIAQEPITQEVRDAYEGQDFTFSKEYILPKPFDKRLLKDVAVAVVKKAMEEKLAKNILNINEYEASF